jgi:hypothetical protein
VVGKWTGKKLTTKTQKARSAGDEHFRSHDSFLVSWLLNFCSWFRTFVIFVPSWLNNPAPIKTRPSLALRIHTGLADPLFP